MYNYTLDSFPYNRYTPKRLRSGNPAPITQKQLLLLDELDAEEYFQEKYDLETRSYNDYYLEELDLT